MAATLPILPHLEFSSKDKIQIMPRQPEPSTIIIRYCNVLQDGIAAKSVQIFMDTSKTFDITFSRNMKGF